MNIPQVSKPLAMGGLAFVLMLAMYFVVVGLISGLDFTLNQFAKFRFFIIALALGFAVQVGLYVYMKQIAGGHGASGKVVAVSGTTSSAAMVSCCAHYLANVLPMLGIAGALTVIAEYQVELFWVGLIFNAAGILYVSSKLAKILREHAT